MIITMGNEEGDDKYHSKILKEELPTSIESAWGIEDISLQVQNVPSETNLLVPESFIFDEPTAPPLDEGIDTRDVVKEPESIQAFHKLFSMLSDNVVKDSNSSESILQDDTEELSELFTKKLDLIESESIMDSTVQNIKSEHVCITASVPTIQETELFSLSTSELESESLSSDQTFQDAPQAVSSESEHNDFHDSLQGIEQENTETISCTNCGRNLESIQDVSFCPSCGQKITGKSPDMFVSSGNEHNNTTLLIEPPNITTTTKVDHDRTLAMDSDYQQPIDEVSSLLFSHSPKKQRQSISPSLSYSSSIVSEIKDASPARVYAVYTFSGPIETHDGYAPSTTSCFPKSQTRVARNPIDGKYSYSLVYTPGTINIQSKGFKSDFVSEFVPISGDRHHSEYNNWILDPIPTISNTQIFVDCIEAWSKQKHHLHLRLYWSWLIDHLQTKSYSNIINLLYNNQTKSMHTSLFSQLEGLLFQRSSKEFARFCTMKRLPHYLLLYSSSSITVIPEHKETLMTSFFRYLDDGIEDIKDSDSRSLLAFRMLLILQYVDDAIIRLVNSDAEMIKRQWKAILLHAFQVRTPTLDPYLYRELGEKVFHRVPELGMIAQLCYIMGVFASSGGELMMPSQLFVISSTLSNTVKNWRQNWWLVYMTNRVVQWINHQSKIISNFDALMCPFIVTANSWYWEWTGEHSRLTCCLEYYRDGLKSKSRLCKQISKILESKKKQEIIVTTPISFRIAQDTFHTPMQHIEPNEKIKEIIYERKDDEKEIEDYGLSNWKQKQNKKEEETEREVTNSSEHRGSILASVASFFKRKPANSESSLSSEGKVATKANLGEESKFKYDPLLKKWVSGDEREEKAATQPPPKAVTTWSEMSSVDASTDESVSMKSSISGNVDTIGRITTPERSNISQSPLSFNPPVMIAASKTTINSNVAPKRQRYTDPFNLTGIGSTS